MRAAIVAACVLVAAVQARAQTPVSVGDVDTAGTVATGAVVTIPSINASAGNLVVACIAWNAPAGQTLAGFQFGAGNPVTGTAVHTANGISQRDGGLYYFTGLSGTADLIVTLSASTDRVYGSAAVLANVDTANPIRGGAGVEGTVTGTALTVNVAATDAADVIVDCYLKNGGNEGTVGANQTQFGTQGSGSINIAHRASYQDGADGTAMSWTWTAGANAWLAAASFQPAAGGGSTINLPAGALTTTGVGRR